MSKLHNKKILFILKKRTLYSEDKYSTVKSGLYNSATFVNDMLVKRGVDSHLVEVVDNTEIDKYVTKHRPDIVIIEALWVVPSKFEILTKLHPKVQWVVRIHSEIPFIANEGIAMEWLKGYAKFDNVNVGANSKDFIESLKPIIERDIFYLPNYYPISDTPNYRKLEFAHEDDVINVGLFGAIRPMKNSLTQAMGAMIYADEKDMKLKLHINTERIEQKGENNLKNIRALFEGTRHELVEHKWLKHDNFLKLVAKMDIGLQVSLSETYNIVTADFISQNVPIITSEEIKFVNQFDKVEKNKNAQVIADKITTGLRNQQPFVWFNRVLLWIDSYKSKREWIKFVKWTK
jgi:hypothetical protein